MYGCVCWSLVVWFGRYVSKVVKFGVVFPVHLGWSLSRLPLSLTLQYFIKSTSNTVCTNCELGWGGWGAHLSKSFPC